MESLAAGIANFLGFQLVLGFIFGIYLAPSIVAVVRGHHRWPWIGFLNFATGRTVAGWIPAEIVPIGGTALRTAQPVAA